MKRWPSINGKGAIGQVVEWLLGLGLSGNALIAVPVFTGAVLAVLGTDLVVSLAAIVLGMIAGWLAMSVLLIVGMGIADSGGGRVHWPADNVRPSRGEQLVWMLAMVVPPFVASGATVFGAKLLAGVSRPLIGLALLVLGLVAGTRAAIASVRRSREEATRRADWLRDRAAAAASDPEFAEQLRTEGWRVDGPYDEMRAAYFRAWESVKRARRASGRPIWRSSSETSELPSDET